MEYIIGYDAGPAQGGFCLVTAEDQNAAILRAVASLAAFGIKPKGIDSVEAIEERSASACRR